MTTSCEFTVEEEVALHGRLLARDPTAFADLATAFLEPLIRWVVEKNSGRVPEDLCNNAAEDALIALTKNPESYKPSLGKGLQTFLRMSAQGDLKNNLRSESRHWSQRISMEVVELSPLAGKYTGVDDDPSLPLQIEEERQKAAVRVIDPARDGLTEGETLALDLVLQGERRTAAFVLALGIGHLPKDAQQEHVKRVKDKLKKRIDRRGGN